MKSFTKTSIAFFTITLLILSCGKDKYVLFKASNAGPDPIIKITGCDGENLILSDNGKTTTSRANIVFWEIIDTESCISKIENIYIKTGKNSDDIFVKGDPRPMDPNDLSKWRGRINPRLRIRTGTTKKWIYSINWIDDVGNKHTYDPTIEVDR